MERGTRKTCAKVGMVMPGWVLQAQNSTVASYRRLLGRQKKKHFSVTWRPDSLKSRRKACEFKGE